MNLLRFPLIVVSMLVVQWPAWAQSFAIRQCAMHPHSNPRGLNKELDNATYDKNWSLLSWDSANPGYTRTDTIPFAWNVNGNIQRVFRGVSNGSVTFTSNPLPSKVISLTQTGSLPDPQLAEKSIGFFGITAKGANDQIFTKVFGTAPNRQYWVKFHSFSLSSDSASGYSVYGTYALVFEENTNNVHFVQMSQGNTTGISVSNQKQAALTMGANWGPFDGVAVADKYDNNTEVNLVPVTLSNGIGDNRYFTIMPFNAATKWNDAALMSAVLNPNSGYIKEDSDMDVSFSFLAQGLTNPKFLTLKLKIGNLPEKSIPLDTFTVSDSFGLYSGKVTVSSSGLILGLSHTASAWLENSVAGESDLTNDSLLKFADLVLQSQQVQVTGYPVIEVFSGNWDHKSAFLDETLKTLKSTNPVVQNSIILHHHVLDPMSTDLSGLITPLTGGLESGEFPLLTLNRGLYENRTDRIVFGEDSLMNRLNAYEVRNTSVVTTIENLKFDPSSKSVTGSYKISTLDYLDPSSFKITVILREKTQRGNTSGWLQRMSLEETKRVGSVFYGKSTKMTGYTYSNVAFDWSSDGNGIDGKPMGNKGITTPGIDFKGTITFTLPDSMVKVTFPKTIDFADSGDAFLRYKPADLEVVVLVTDDRIKSMDKNSGWNVSAPIVSATIQPVWDVLASVDQKTKTTLNAYPNPSTGNLWLSANRDINNFEIMDMRGQLQHVQALRSSNKTILLNTETLKPGLYIIAVMDANNQRQTLRFIKGM